MSVSNAMPAEQRSSPRAWAGVLLDLALGRRGRLWQVVLWLAMVLLLLRLIAPYVLTAVANSILARPGNYRGAISGVSLGLLSGNYSVHDLRLDVRQPDQQWEPLLAIDDLHCALSWPALMSGQLRGKIVIDRPRMIVRTETPTQTNLPPATAPPPSKPPTSRPEPSDKDEPAERWQDRLRRIVSFQIDRLDIAQGTLTYIDEEHHVNADLSAIDGSITGLIVDQDAKSKRAAFHFTGRTIADGAMMLDGTVDPLAERPTFLLKAQVEHLELPKLNPLSRNFDNLTFASGQFSGYAEAVGDGRRIGGYLKVLFHQLDIASYRDFKDGDGTGGFWKLAISAAEQVLENEDEQQHAARLPISGPIDDPAADVWATIGSTLRNAFISALVPGFDSTRKKSSK